MASSDDVRVITVTSESDVALDEGVHALVGIALAYLQLPFLHADSLETGAELMLEFGQIPLLLHQVLPQPLLQQRHLRLR